MIQESDSVVLTEDIPNLKLAKGDIGTVVLVHDDGEGYEVEFEVSRKVKLCKNE